MVVLHIKNMVCDRCIEAVIEEFGRLSVPVSSVSLGAVETEISLSESQKSQISASLKKRGFELLEDKNSQIIEQIKNLIVSSIHRNDKKLSTNYSTFLEDRIGKDYSSLSSLFSTMEGITIEKFIILQKLEKVKELLVYNELSLSQIAYKLGYSSVQHLSNQFKKSTGITPSEFKKSGEVLRKPIDQVVK